uniref:Uncharacterized protein n=1 Tax=Anopheles atroparvus TaxID=41427 RepID=A0A182JCP9_ANOAO
MLPRRLVGLLLVLTLGVLLSPAVEPCAGLRVIFQKQAKTDQQQKANILRSPNFSGSSCGKGQICRPGPLVARAQPDILVTMQASNLLTLALLLTVAVILLEIPPGADATRVIYRNLDHGNRLAHMLSSPNSSKCPADTDEFPTSFPWRALGQATLKRYHKEELQQQQ